MSDPSASRSGGDAVVIGSGRNVWNDLDAINLIAQAPVYFVVNDMVVFAPRVMHAVSHHADKLLLWVQIRNLDREHVRRDRVITHSSRTVQGIDRIWLKFRFGGSSSLLAVRIALEVGHPRVFVAGVPLDAGGYVWADPREKHDDRGPQDYARYRGAWQDLRKDLAGRTFSPSGWLGQTFGWPDRIPERAAVEAEPDEAAAP